MDAGGTIALLDAALLSEIERNKELTGLLTEVLARDESVQECSFCMSIPTAKGWSHVSDCLASRIRRAMAEKDLKVDEESHLK